MGAKAEREKAEAASRARSQFLAYISHGIRTPISQIIGMTELALATGLTEEQRDYLETVKTWTESLMKVVNDALVVSEIEAGALEMAPTDFHLRKSLDETLGLLALQSHKKGLELVCHVKPEVPDALVGDEGCLRQVLTNLLDNAIRFTEQGEVVVSAREDRVGPRADDEVRLHFAVTDTGTGIPDEEQESIFGTFAQAAGPTTRSHGGTGLGLAISRELVSLMDGKLWVESETGEGSAFHFTVRMQLQHCPQQSAAGPDAEKLKGLRVIVVDDNTASRLVLEDLLVHWRVRHTAVGSGSAALNEMKRAVSVGEAYDCALIDDMMPEMDGLTLAGEIRGNPELAGASLIMLSAAVIPPARGDDAARCQELGVAACLTKPVRQSELSNALMAVADALSPRAKPELGPEEEPQWQGRRPLKVLLAEDSETDRQVVMEMMEKRGHEVRAVCDGDQVLDILKGQNFDVILMDLQLPVMDGYKTAATIRGSENAEGMRIPIIAMTAHPSMSDRERCISAGMDGYVSKPVEAGELLAAIHSLVPVAEDGQPSGQSGGQSATIPDPQGAPEYFPDDGAVDATGQSDAEVQESVAGVEAIKAPSLLSDEPQQPRPAAGQIDEPTQENAVNSEEPASTAESAAPPDGTPPLTSRPWWKSRRNVLIGAALGLVACAFSAILLFSALSGAKGSARTLGRLLSGPSGGKASERLAPGNVAEPRTAPARRSESARDVAAIVLSKGAIEAVAELQEEAKRNPGSATAAILLGRARFLAHDMDGAEKEFRRALGIDPSSEAAREGLQALQGLKSDESAVRHDLPTATIVASAGSSGKDALQEIAPGKKKEAARCPATGTKARPETEEL